MLQQAQPTCGYALSNQKQNPKITRLSCLSAKPCREGRASVLHPEGQHSTLPYLRCLFPFLGPNTTQTRDEPLPFSKAKEQSEEEEGRLGPFFLLSGKGSRLSNELQPRGTRCSRPLPAAAPHAPRRRPGVSRAGPGRSSPDVSPARSGEARELSPSKS